MTDEPMLRCASCGAPLIKDHRDEPVATRLGRCPGCVRSDGSPMSFDEVAKRMAAHLRESLGLSRRASLEIAIDRISRQPAWAAPSQLSEPRAP